MKLKNPLVLALVILLSLGLSSQCTQPKENSTESETMSEEGQDSELTLSNFEVIHCGSSEPDPECPEVYQQLQDYADFIDTMKLIYPTTQPVVSDSPTVEQLHHELFTLRGFKYNIQELRDLLELASDSDTSIYVMFAITNNGDRESICGSGEIKYLDAYFQVNAPNGEVVTFRPSLGKRSLSDFTDFPCPCPTSCPDDPTI